MTYIYRIKQKLIEDTLARGKSVLLLGARQTGKTTLMEQIAAADLRISLIQPATRQRYERQPSSLLEEVEALPRSQARVPLVILDEVQKAPVLLDVAQDLIDRHVAQFILTGSSARKLRTGTKINWLPGRVVAIRLDPLTLTELSSQGVSLDDLLLYGSLPGIVTTPVLQNRDIDLASYVTTYLEEEIRMEAVVRNVGLFAQFVSLAAAESGNLVNFSRLSQNIGVAHTTIAAYYQILEDCLIAERVEPLTQSSTRRRLAKTQKYIFFDLGVRRLSAEEGIHLPREYMGRLFEQWVGLELIRCARFSLERIKIYFWRDLEGPEVDWVIKKGELYIPVEVKYTDSPNANDIKHLLLFQREYPNTQIAYLVCQVPRRRKMADNVYAIPWTEVDQLLLSSD